jgi:hypothetical protein
VEFVFSVQKMLGNRKLDTSLRYSALLTEDLIHDHATHPPVISFLKRKR